PSADGSQGFSAVAGSVRITGGTNRRLRMFAVAQVAACFVLLVGAATLVRTLISLQSAKTGMDTRRVLALNLPVMTYGKTPEEVVRFYQESIRQISSLPGVDAVAMGTNVPWRDAGNLGPGFQFSADGHVRGADEQDPRAQFRTISPGFFDALGVPI